VKPSTPLAGEAELAERKGTWKYNAEAIDAAKSDAATSEVGTSGDAPVADTGATAPADPGASESDAENNDTSGGADTATPEPERAATTETVIKPSTPLTGEAELAARKGSWKYEAGGPAAGAAASSSEGGEDFDEDGILEGLDEGSKPALLDAPEGGKADNLKEIKGIGPKLEKACNAMGVYHFHQIAAWSDEEVAWVNANLIGFKGRVTRDKWVEQAKILAEGGETEFSKRVEEGGVY
jgi:predicted flap endonuclease-1-like 5' DNA nuclease